VGDTSTVLKDFERALKKNLSLRTSAVAIKLVRRGDDLPTDKGRPVVELGGPIVPCVGWHHARHLGQQMVMLPEDAASDCPLGVFVFGFAEDLQPWLSGDLAHGTYAASRQAGVIMESEVHRLKPGACKGIVLSPLEQADFHPDVVMVYCNSQEAMRLVTASEYETGEPLRLTMAARAVCSDGVIQAFLSGRPVVAIPCRGDRIRGGTQDDELVFVAPAASLEQITVGLEAFDPINQIDRLGGQSALQRQYAKMAAALEASRTD
jgi:uncharacterized protein (DUF169 family)